MRAIEMASIGGPEVLRCVQRPTPVPGPGEVVVKINAAGVNRVDAFQRAGLYRPPPGTTDIPGVEFAGEIAARGPGTSRFKVGDRVCGITIGGGYAEYCAVPAPHCLPVPAGLSVLEAASLPENYFTVYDNVFNRGRLKAGETFLVHGGSSGIGLAAIQLARVFGATVYTTVGSDAKAEFVRQAGAHAAFNYNTQDWAAELWKLTAKRGVDVILDMVGGDYVAKNLRSLALEGRLVQIAFLKESKLAELDLMPIMLKRLTFTGSTLRPRTVQQKADIARQLRESVWPLFASRQLRTHIHRTFPLAEAAAAHALMESSQHIGKIMLEVRA